MPLIPHDRRSLAALTHDVAAAVLAWALAYWLRFNLDIPDFYVHYMWRYLAWVIPLQTGCFLAFGLYRGIWRYASLPDLKQILFAALSAMACVLAAVVVFGIPHIPRAALLMYPLILVMIMGGSRFLYRAWKEHIITGAAGDARPLVILGAGDAAADLIKHLSRDRSWRIIGLLADNAARLGRRIHGVTVLGPLEKLPDVAGRFRVKDVVIALPEATLVERRRALEICSQAGVRAMTVPSLTDIVSGRVTISQIRQVELDDLLGRPPVTLDTSAMTSWLAHRVVMVTGAGGSIGAELCRQIAQFHPSLIVLYEMSEFALYSLEQEFRARFPDVPIEAVVGDVKDGVRLRQIMGQFAPTALFHAAAYKHVPLMEDINAWEAVRNNVLGTLEAARAAAEQGVHKFVLVSTDKAVNPTNVMGATKRLAEMVCSALQQTNTRFVTVRFGNVLGSTGSVIPKFKEQILAGGPVTVTHPDITRYFMSIPEAAQLVLQAGLMGQGGEIFVLDMGEPIRILDLAKDLIRLSGYTERDVHIEFSGLRPGEKLYEELLADGEKTLPTPHPKLRIASSTPVPADWLTELREWMERPPGSGEEVRGQLASRLAEYSPGGSG